MMTKLAPTTPLYNHPLPDIEQWLRDMGCEQSRDILRICCFLWLLRFWAVLCWRSRSRLSEEIRRFKPLVVCVCLRAKALYYRLRGNLSELSLMILSNVNSIGHKMMAYIHA